MRLDEWPIVAGYDQKSFEVTLAATLGYLRHHPIKVIVQLWAVLARQLVVEQAKGVHLLADRDVVVYRGLSRLFITALQGADNFRLELVLIHVIEAGIDPQSVSRRAGDHRVGRHVRQTNAIVDCQ